jgi:signal transduction histidine kinase
VIELPDVVTRPSLAAGQKEPSHHAFPEHGTEPSMSTLHAPFAAPAVEEIPVAIWVGKPPDGEYLYANPACFALFGNPRAGVTRHCEVDAVARMPFQRALEARATVTVDDLVHHRADGSRSNLRAVARPMFCSQGNVSHVIVAFSETSLRLSGEATAEIDAAAEIASLRQALNECQQVAILHERLRDAVNHAPLIIFALDREGIVKLAEGKAITRLERSPGQTVGRSVHDIYRDYPAVLGNIERALRGESFTALVELGPLMFETWYAPIAGPEGGVLGVANDVTERRRMEATLLSAERMVAVGTIAASVAHEINNPLSYVIACLELLVRDSHAVLELGALLAARYPDDADAQRIVFELERAREPFENIRDGIERMRLIARDLRTFARVDDPELTPIDVREVLRSAIRMSSNETRYRASVVTDFAPVPWVMASEPRLAQVFLNLLVNAA